ncbi:TIGR02099 family protein [Legionella jordanis]|uniref:YhdP family protein n=1 Tax=Legionella jordanis TaxID=456 RepID=UPI000EFFE7C4|nr:YhdP family protein [Legionella jordanis]RMX15277.1 TIGR02099 family protein [Legionella jordanis]
MNKFLKRCWMPLAILIITAAVISSLFRALTPWATQYKSEVEQHLSTILGGPVTINTMETGWYWFEPVVKLNQVEVLSDSKSVLKLDKLLVGIDLFSSLWHWQIQPGVLLIDDLHLSVHQTSHGWQLDGFTNSQNMALDAESLKPIFAWILAQQKIMLKNVSTQIHLKDGSLISLKDLNLAIINRAGRYRIKGTTHLDQRIPSQFEFLANLKLDANSLNKASGQMFLSIQDFLPEQWQKFMPESRFEVSGGGGDLQMWADLKNGHFQTVQGRFNFSHLLLTDNKTEKDQFIHSFKANLAWKPTHEGWQLSGDHIGLRLSGTTWPENSFVLDYKNSQDYFIYVKNILLQSLMNIAIPWPDSMQPLLSLQPHGVLHDTQLKADANGLNYALSRFANLGWLPSKKYPGMENLSGVLHWQPNEGRLEIDSKDSTISYDNKPPIIFNLINAAFDWKELDQGLRVSMERLVLSHPNLLLSAQGVADEVSGKGMGALRLNAQFSANRAEKWLTYLPKLAQKPKLEHWLKQDIKRIEKATGELVINGNMADFPFDKEQGIFSVKSYLSGVELIFAPKWPVTRQIDAFLNIDKRNLEANILHANLQGIEVSEGNLRIDDLGLDREVLLTHAKAETDAKKAMVYVQQSPLSKKLSALKRLEMKGPVELDLQLEAPLYPENDDILALGSIQFKGNSVKVHHSLDDVELKNLAGHLQFDQDSVLGSDLQASILGNPIKLLIKSIHSPVPATEIKIKGEADAKALRERFKLPLLSFVQGAVSLEGLLTLTDAPGDLDHLQIQSSLQGLSVDLPAPFGKDRLASKPLLINIDFNPEKAIRLRFNYDNQLRSDLWFAGHTGAFNLQKGKLVVGNPGSDIRESQHGVQVVGTLSNFDLQEWLKLKEKISKSAEHNELADVISLINIKLQSARIFNLNYKDLTFKAMKLEKGEWGVNLNQEHVVAHLRYHPESNSIRGLVERLHLDQFNQNSLLSERSLSKLSPGEMPNLDLRVASLKLRDIDIGSMSLKTTALKNQWQINSCKIKSPFYEFNAKGDWSAKGKTNTTRVQANLEINNLAKGLEKWNVSPVVEADRGIVKFQGEWPGAVYDFSLAKVNGGMGISFKDGRITNLSPETEEKLGLGKLLSILSLQTIPRRLKLGFSDLAEGGYSFDEFNGSFNVAHGVMTTEDSYIDGPVAYASMKGSLDIAKQYYDLDLKVNPHITASLPVVATIAGGPIAGIATWVASKLINNGMQKISGYTYKITGPWKQPVVQQVKIFKKRKA